MNTKSHHNVHKSQTVGVKIHNHPIVGAQIHKHSIVGMWIHNHPSTVPININIKNSKSTPLKSSLYEV